LNVYDLPVLPTAVGRLSVTLLLDASTSIALCVVKTLNETVDAITIPDIIPQVTVRFVADRLVIFAVVRLVVPKLVNVDVASILIVEPT
jgi:hypothetical protein